MSYQETAGQGEKEVPKEFGDCPPPKFRMVIRFLSPSTSSGGPSWKLTDLNVKSQATELDSIKPEEEK